MMPQVLLAAFFSPSRPRLKFSGKRQRTVASRAPAAGAQLWAEPSSTLVSGRSTPFPSRVPVLTRDGVAQPDAFQFY